MSADRHLRLVSISHGRNPCLAKSRRCHSGSCLDLPYIYSTEGKIKEPNLLAEAGQGLLGAGMSYLRGDLGGMFKGVMA